MVNGEINTVENDFHKQSKEKMDYKKKMAIESIDIESVLVQSESVRKTFEEN